jgi:iron complex transport system ATP-binding protein
MVVSAAIEVTELGYSYPRQGQRLEGISFTVGVGAICCLLGPNGAGKTTLLRCLLNLIPPQRGSIRIAGTDRRSLTPRDLARRIAYVPQTAAMPFSFTALDIVVMGRTPYIGVLAAPSAVERATALGHLEGLGIRHLAARPFAELSGGERQLVLIARALAQDAPILVLDEPTAALDYGNAAQLLRLVARLAGEGRTILMTTHQPDHALRLGGQVLLMRDGHIAASGPVAEVAIGEALSSLYGVAIHVADVMLPNGGRLRTSIPLQDEVPR